MALHPLGGAGHKTTFLLFHVGGVYTTFLFFSAQANTSHAKLFREEEYATLSPLNLSQQALDGAFLVQQCLR